MKPQNFKDKLLLGKSLTFGEATFLFQKLLSGKKIDLESIKLILCLLHVKGETADEIAGVAGAVKKLEKPITRKRFPYLVDGCGTGGDGTNTFNISTTASLIAAGAGANVAKHGNRSISSQCGSADLLEAFGVKIDASPRQMLTALERCQIGYFHAPLYHRSFKVVQALRKKLKSRYQIRTVFNVIGPLLNPLRPARQVIGVFDRDLAQKVALAAKKLKLKHVMIVHSPQHQMDEFSTISHSLVYELKNGKIVKRIIFPGRFGFLKGRSAQFKGGGPALNRKITTGILKGRDRGPRREIVLLNAAAILYTSGLAKNLKAGITLAEKSLNSGAALKTLNCLVKISHDLK